LPQLNKWVLEKKQFLFNAGREGISLKKYKYLLLQVCKYVEFIYILHFQIKRIKGHVPY